MPVDANPVQDEKRLSHGGGKRTLSIIKPDAVAKNVIGRSIRASKPTLKIVAARMTLLSRAKQRLLCGASRASILQGSRRFHGFGPIMIQVLEGENAITKNRI